MATPSGPAGGTRGSARRALQASMQTPTRAPEATAPAGGTLPFTDKVKVVQDHHKVCQAFAESVKSESFNVFHGGETNTYASFAKFRRLLLFFLVNDSKEFNQLLDETARGPFSQEAKELL